MSLAAAAAQQWSMARPGNGTQCGMQVRKYAQASLAGFHETRLGVAAQWIENTIEYHTMKSARAIVTSDAVLQPPISSAGTASCIRTQKVELRFIQGQAHASTARGTRTAADPELSGEFLTHQRQKSLVTTRSFLGVGVLSSLCEYCA